MAYCSNVETSEGPTACLRRLATLRKRKQRAGRGQDRGEIRGREQKQRDLDESEQEARQSHVC